MALSGSRLEASVRVRLARLDLDVAITVEPGEVLAVVGPNGAGKTTLLRALAGLERLSGGRVVLGAEVLEDVGAGVHVPPERRPVGVVFQDNLLFPHLSALDNVAFALRARGTKQRDARAAAAAWLDRMDLAAVGRARPAALSGGQARRVALARTLVASPRLLLLDEPLAVLDATTAASVRRVLRRHLSEPDGARILVTHDPVDALMLADRLVVVEAGRVVQEGTPASIAQRPRTRYVADLVGVNLVCGRSDGTTVMVGDVVVTTAERAAGEVFLAIRPAAVALHRERPQGSPRNAWPAAVVGLDGMRDRIRVSLAGPFPLVAEITPAALADLRLADGDHVWAVVKATEVDVYPA